MASLAAIYEQPESKEDWIYWSFQHQAHHRDIIRVIFERNQVTLSLFLLDPMDPDNMDRWLYWHQVMHQEMDAVLNIKGYNLLDLDWRDEGQLAQWINFNGDEHYQASTILGV
jgi:hypothetical protein